MKLQNNPYSGFKIDQKVAWNGFLRETSIKMQDKNYYRSEIRYLNTYHDIELTFQNETHDLTRE